MADLGRGLYARAALAALATMTHSPSPNWFCRLSGMAGVRCWRSSREMTDPRVRSREAESAPDPVRHVDFAAILLDVDNGPRRLTPGSQ